MEYVKLKGLVDLKQGMAINSKSNHLVVDHETSLPLLRIADMPTKRKVIFMDESTPERFWADENDIIYTRTGQVGLVFRGQKGVVHNNCFRVIPFDEKVLDRNYLYWVLTLKSIYNYANSIAAGSAQPDLPHDSFKTIQIPFFDIEVQRKIVNILDCYDKTIENNNKHIKILEQMAENLYKEWFVRFRFPCHEDVEFIAGEPQAWKLTKLEEIINIDRGLSYSSEEIDCDEGIDLVNLKNIQAFGGFRVDGTKKYSGKFKEQQIVKRGDLVMGVTDMTQDRRTVGAVALIPVIHNTSVISADLIKITSKLNNVFMYCMFKYGGVSRYISQFANGANVLHLRPQVVSAVKVFLPTENLIEGFSEIVQPIIDEIDLLNEKNDNLVKQRDLLLPRLMSGKLEVK